MILASLVISFLLEGVFTNLISFNSLFLPLFTVTSLTILYPYFNNNQVKFIGVGMILGFFYDIIYTDSLFINTFSFAIISIAIIIIYNYINMNWINVNVLNVVIVIIFKITTYLLLCVVGYMHFKSGVLIKGVYSSVFANVIYGLILYGVTYKIGKRLNLKRLE